MNDAKRTICHNDLDEDVIVLLLAANIQTCVSNLIGVLIWKKLCRWG